MPLKRAVIPLLDNLSATARLVAAVNTVLLTSDGLVGDNTDVPGMIAALRPVLSPNPPAQVAVLGAGATAASALAALGRLGVDDVTVYARSEHSAAGVRAMRQRLGMTVHTRPWSEAADAMTGDLLISTTPPGATDALAASVLARDAGGDLGAVERRPVPRALLDVVYDPWPTPLVAAWAEAGGRVVSGLDLLVEQAALQVELMTELSPAPIEAMRAAGEAALADRLAVRPSLDA
jgi:shikimate dehydrogenase